MRCGAAEKTCQCVWFGEGMLGKMIFPDTAPHETPAPERGALMFIKPRVRQTICYLNV
jgi:hypothetical protein